MSDIGAPRRTTPPSRPTRALPAAIVLLAVVLGLAAPNLTEGAQAARLARSWAPTSATDVVLQSDPEGCGAALLATILHRRGQSVTEAQLLAAAPPGPNGISLRQFQTLAAAHGLVGTWRRAARATVPRGSFVAHLDRPDGHFVWVLASAGDYLHVVDPAVGEGVWHADRFLRRFSGRYLRLAGLA